MAGERVLNVKVMLDGAGQVGSVLAQMGRQGEQAGGKIHSAFRKAGGGIGGLFATIQKNWLAALAVITAAIRMVGSLSGSFSAAARAEEDLNLASVVLAENLGEVSQWAKTASASLVQTKTETLKQVSTFAEMANKMGMAKDAAIEMGKGLTQMVGDFSSFYNLQPAEAFTKITAAITGEYTPMKRLGIVLSENIIKEAAYRDAIAKRGAELTPAQKAQAVYNELLRQGASAMGDLERTQDSTSNSLKQIKARWDEITVSFGNFIKQSPIIQAGLNFIKDALTDLNVFFTEGKRQGIVAAMAEQWAEAKAILAPIWDSLKSEFMEIFGGTIDWFKENWPLILETIRVVGAAIAAWWQAWGPTIIGIFQSIWNTLKLVVKTALDLILGIIKVVMQLITGDWKGAWNTILETSKSIWGSIKQFIADQLQVIKNILKKALEWIHDKWLWLKDKLVGNSVVPDMVDAIIGEFDRMGISLAALSERNLTNVLGIHRKFARDLLDILTSVPSAEQLLADEAIMGGKSPVGWRPMRMRRMAFEPRVRGGPGRAFEAGTSGFKNTFSRGAGLGSSILASILEQIQNPDFGSSLGQAALSGGKGLGSLISGIGGSAVGSAISGKIGAMTTGGLLGMIPGSFAGPVGMLVSTLFSGLLSKGFGKLFGGGKAPKPVEPIPVKVVNWSDMLSALLNVTKSQLAGRAAPGIDRLSQLRMASAVTGVR